MNTKTGQCGSSATQPPRPETLRTCMTTIVNLDTGQVLGILSSPGLPPRRAARQPGPSLQRRQGPPHTTPSYWPVSPPPTGRWGTQAQATKTTHPGVAMQAGFSGIQKRPHYPTVTRQQPSMADPLTCRSKTTAPPARPPPACVRACVRACSRSKHGCPDTLSFPHGDGTGCVHWLGKGTPNNHE
jgi:hypothetical protein